jgi:hypothetical protein
VTDTANVPKVVLEYPNGRRHEVELDSEQRLDIGDSFDLHGRRWRVMSVTSPRKAGSRRYHDTYAIVCRPITASPLSSVSPSSERPANQSKLSPDRRDRNGSDHRVS